MTFGQLLNPISYAEHNKNLLTPSINLNHL